MQIVKTFIIILLMFYHLFSRKLFGNSSGGDRIPKFSLQLMALGGNLISSRPSYDLMVSISMHFL